MRDIRISLVTIVMTLICLGIIMVYSSSGVYALQELGDAMYFLNRHLIFLAIGFVMSLVIMAIDYRQLQPYAKPALLACVLLLVLVLIPGVGKATYGARRWFRLGPVHLQPSELMKFVILLYAADYLSRKRTHIRKLTTGFLPMMIVLGCVCVLIVKQPDLGSAVLIAAIVLSMMFIAGARIRHLFGFFLTTIPVLYFLVFKVPYRLRRIIAFINPWADSLGAGFQLSQSQIALGSGGLWGVGLGKSSQKLFYLPAAHTDFVLSIIGEELGFVGTFAVICLFIAFIWQGARIAKRVSEPFGYFLAVGIVTMIGLQALVNIGVSIGALPTKGLPLPFISYGGSALIFNMMSIGLLLNISRVEEF